MIYLRYVRNFLNGSGLVYNPGVYFNGLTSPLYSYLAILTGLLLDNLQSANILLATILHASALIVFTEVFFASNDRWRRAACSLFWGGHFLIFSWSMAWKPLFSC
ncbi:MAG: hypothetical protein U5O69_00325 [Candidatus Competibacteraceae bacterium]|nr:hypothetical protein [Candidatus Competibacteraceae bacterium]